MADAPMRCTLLGGNRGRRQRSPAARESADAFASCCPCHSRCALCCSAWLLPSAPSFLCCSDVQDIQVEEMVVEEVQLDPMTALKIVLRTSMFHDGLARGLHEAVKALDRREAHLCVLANSCDEPAYTKLITALCKEHSIPLIKVEDNKTLGEWAGLARFNAEGKAVKVVGCSCVVVRSWGEETSARQYILDHVKSA